MHDFLHTPCTAFDGVRRLAAGPLIDVAVAVRDATVMGSQGPLFIFDDTTGNVVDVDIRGTADQVIARLARRPENSAVGPSSQAPPDGPAIGEAANGEPATGNPPTGESRGRGRPKIGVVPREVTLLPRHWDWLNAQPGGASVTLRKLVEQARKSSGDRDRTRAAQTAAYRFMSAMAGDLPGFEEASRALFASDRRGFSEQISAWPADIRDHAIRLAFADLKPQRP